MASLKDFNHVDLLFPSKYLKAADLRGGDLTVIIRSIEPRGELQMRQGRKEYKPIATLDGTDKLWVMNKTNAVTISKLYGPEVLSWIGKRVTLYPTLVACGGAQVEAVRVREKVPHEIAPAKLRTVKVDPREIISCIDSASSMEELEAAVFGAKHLDEGSKEFARKAYRDKVAELMSKASARDEPAEDIIVT